MPNGNSFDRNIPNVLKSEMEKLFLPELFFISKLDSLIDFKAGQDQVFSFCSCPI